MIEGSLEVKLPTIRQYDRSKCRGGKSQRREEERRSGRERESKKEDAGARKGKNGKQSRETLCFSNELWLRRVEK